MDLDIPVVISFVLYLLLMLFIGWYYYRKTQNINDYFLAGRKLNSWVVALSAQASDMSGWLLLGLPGYAYLAGLEAGWIALGLAIGTYFNWKFVAKPLRVETEKLSNSLTLPQFFENRFNDMSHALRIISSLFIIIFFLIYTSSGFVAGAKLFTSIFPVTYHQALFISVLIIISYTFLGGFHAVSITDLIQGILMFLAIILVPAIVINHLNGVSTIIDSLENKNPEFLNPWTSSKGEKLSWITITSSMAWGLGYFGQPHILARFMAIRDVKLVKRSQYIAMSWVLISLSFAVIVGMIGISFFESPLPDSEKVFIELIFTNAPVILAGVFLSAILAAIMSTADSQLLVTSSSIVDDILKVFSKKVYPEKITVWLSRLAVILVAVIASLIGLNPESKVLNLVSYAWAGFGATFGPVILTSLYSKRVTTKGAIIGMLIGGITVIVWKNLQGGIFDLYEIVPGFLFSFIAILLFLKKD